MTDVEIAAHQRGVLSAEEIAAHPEMETLKALRADPLFPQLCATFEADEGNLLELTEPDTALQQIATIRWAVETYGSNAPRATVAEVGFHKGFFALALRSILYYCHLHYFACDVRPESAHAAALLNDSDTMLDIHFTLGDSRLVWADVLESIGAPADIAWIDGSHEPAVLAHDLSLAMDYGARLILVDDAAWLPKLGGIISDCCNVYGYTRVTPPTSEDRRGIAVLVRP